MANNTSLSTFLLLLAYVTHIVAYLCTHTVLRASHNKGKVCQPPLVLLWATPTTLWPNTLPQSVPRKHACNQSYANSSLHNKQLLDTHFQKTVVSLLTFKKKT